MHRGYSGEKIYIVYFLILKKKKELQVIKNTIPITYDMLGYIEVTREQ